MKAYKLWNRHFGCFISFSCGYSCIYQCVHVICLPIIFTVASLELGQYDCSSAIGVTLEYLGRIDLYYTSTKYNQERLHAYRADSRFAASQWETALLCNDVSHWLGASLESALCISIGMYRIHRWTLESGLSPTSWHHELECEVPRNDFSQWWFWIISAPQNSV